MIETKSSDLHLKVGSPPGLRIHGDLMPIDGEPALTPDALRTLIYEILSDEHREKLEREKELDFAYSLPGVARFRVNVFFQRGSLGAVFRVIPFKILTLDELNMPDVLKTLALKPRGLVLVTGPTGSGKSTTLAAMVDYINSSRRCHILTIEDPIEFLHKDKLSYVNQREVESDTRSFSEALKRALRQDPDVILIGEMRDLETISAAITAAETGHLVFGTLHTIGAAPTVDRIIDVFPPHQQEQIRMQLSITLQGVISQVLLPRKDGSGRVAALEILVATPGIRNLIREGKTHMIGNMIQAGGGLGMVSLDQSLGNLVRDGIVDFDEAVAKAQDPDTFQKTYGAFATGPAPNSSPFPF